MRITAPAPGDPLTPQQAFNRVKARIQEVQDDTFEIEVLLRCLAKMRQFIKDRFPAVE